MGTSTTNMNYVYKVKHIKAPDQYRWIKYLLCKYNKIYIDGLLPGSLKSLSCAKQSTVFTSNANNQSVQLPGLSRLPGSIHVHKDRLLNDDSNDKLCI